MLEVMQRNATQNQFCRTAACNWFINSLLPCWVCCLCLCFLLSCCSDGFTGLAAVNVIRRSSPSGNIRGCAESAHIARCLTAPLSSCAIFHNPGSHFDVATAVPFSKPVDPLAFVSLVRGGTEQPRGPLTAGLRGATLQLLHTSGSRVEAPPPHLDMASLLMITVATSEAIPHWFISQPCGSGTSHAPTLAGLLT